MGLLTYEIREVADGQGDVRVSLITAPGVRREFDAITTPDIFEELGIDMQDIREQHQRRQGDFAVSGTLFLLAYAAAAILTAIIISYR